MNQTTLATSTPTPTLSPLIAWRNALGIVVLLWLLLGLVNFAVITNFLASIMPSNLLLASLLFSHSPAKLLPTPLIRLIPGAESAINRPL